MEVRVRERLIGALVLVGIIVLLVPAILTGGADRQPPDRVADETQTVEIQLGDDAPPAGSDELVPEPEIPGAQPDAAAEAAVPPPQPADPLPATELPPEPAPVTVEPAAPAKPHPDATAVERPTWAVQLGAFSSREKADRLVADLRARGYAAFLLEYRGSGQVLHRVRVGPEQDRSRAVAVAERLRKDGFQPVVAPHP